MHRCEFRKTENLQDTKREDCIDADLFVEIHLELIDEESRQAQDRYVDDDVCDATDDIHDWVIGRSHADYPVAPERPDLKKSCEEK